MRILHTSDWHVGKVLKGRTRHEEHIRVLGQVVEIARAERARTLVAIHWIDLDHFKAVNDSYGHGIGDEVLKETAKRLDELAESGYVVARLGGDEFVIVQVGLGHPGDAVAFAEKVCTRLNEPLLRAGDNPVAMGASIGVAVFPHDGRDAETLAHSADVALYRAKEAGRNRVE